MSGAFVVNELLSAYAPLIAIVPAVRIHYGFVPVTAPGNALPAILVREISGVQRNILGMNATAYLQTDRVQADAFASTYLQMRALLELMRKACPNTRGTVATIAVESVLFQGRGPDLSDEAAKIFNQSIDLMVTWRASST